MFVVRHLVASSAMWLRDYHACTAFHKLHDQHYIYIVGDSESNQFAHYVMIYERVYGEIYDVPVISVHFDTCTDSVYQALFSGLGTRLAI